MPRLDAFDRGYLTGVAVSFACFYFLCTRDGSRRLARWLREASDSLEALSAQPLVDLFERQEVSRADH